MKTFFPIKDISGISGHTGTVFGIWRIKRVVFQFLKWNHMGSCLPVRLALDLTHVMGVWLINRVFQSCTHWPLDLAQRGHCFPFTNEVDFGFFLSWLEMCNILFLFKSLKPVRTKLSETPAGKWQRQSESLGEKLFFLFPGKLVRMDNTPTGGLAMLRPLPPSPPMVFSMRCVGSIMSWQWHFKTQPFPPSKKSTHLCPYQGSPVCNSSAWNRRFQEGIERKQNANMSSLGIFRSLPLHISPPSTICYEQWICISNTHCWCFLFCQSYLKLCV